MKKEISCRALVVVANRIHTLKSLRKLKCLIWFKFLVRNIRRVTMLPPALRIARFRQYRPSGDETGFGVFKLDFQIKNYIFYKFYQLSSKVKVKTWLSDLHKYSFWLYSALSLVKKVNSNTSCCTGGFEVAWLSGFEFEQKYRMEHLILKQLNFQT